MTNESKLLLEYVNTYHKYDKKLLGEVVDVRIESMWEGECEVILINAKNERILIETTYSQIYSFFASYINRQKSI